MERRAPSPVQDNFEAEKKKGGRKGRPLEN